VEIEELVEVIEVVLDDGTVAAMVVLDVKVVVIVLAVNLDKTLQAGSNATKRTIRHKNGSRNFVLFILPFHFTYLIDSIIHCDALCAVPNYVAQF